MGTTAEEEGEEIGAERNAGRMYVSVDNRMKVLSHFILTLNVLRFVCVLNHRVLLRPAIHSPPSIYPLPSELSQTQSQNHNPNLLPILPPTIHFPINYIFALDAPLAHDAYFAFQQRLTSLQAFRSSRMNSFSTTYLMSLCTIRETKHI